MGGREKEVPFREVGDPTLFRIKLWERGAAPHSFAVFWEQPPPSISVIVRSRFSAGWLGLALGDT